MAIAPRRVPEQTVGYAYMEPFAEPLGEDRAGSQGGPCRVAVSSDPPHLGRTPNHAGRGSPWAKGQLAAWAGHPSRLTQQHPMPRAIGTFCVTAAMVPIAPGTRGDASSDWGEWGARSGTNHQQAVAAMFGIWHLSDFQLNARLPGVGEWDPNSPPAMVLFGPTRFGAWTWMGGRGCVNLAITAQMK